MLIFFGTRSKVVEGPEGRGHACPQCGQGHHVSFAAIRYFHIFWIPVFPFSRTIGVQCSHCKHTITGNEVPETFRDGIRTSAFTRNRVFPLFTGSVLIASLVGFVVHAAQQDARLELDYIQNPVASDVYVMDFSRVFEEVDQDYRFGVMRVVTVGDSIVELSVSNYGYDKPHITRSGLARDMAADDFFAEETVTIGRDDLVAFKRDNTIRDIRRDP